MNIKSGPSITDVAKKAGVSNATVSRVLTNKKGVRPETSKKVVAAANELKYKPENYTSRKIKKTNTIAAIISDLTDPFFAITLKGIEEEARLHGYSLILYNSANSPFLEKQSITMLLNRDIDGLIIVPTDDDPAICDLFIENKLPHVFLDRVIDKKNINFVVSDDLEGAYQATTYLLDLGHKDILYIGGENKFSTEKNRLAGFKRALREHKFPINNELIRECSFHYQEAFQETMNILHEGTIFSAIFAATDLIAFGAKAAAEKLGKKIPEDISIIGYGDIPASEYISLSTVSSPSLDMGKRAFLLLLDYIEGRLETSKQITLRPSIVFRSTCKHYSNNE